MTTKSGLNPADFETTIEGKQTSLFMLTNEDGMEVCITNYGARVVSCMVPNLRREWADVVLGFSSISGYLKANEVYHGATIGRYANRIANGQFSLDGTTYDLAQNNGSNSLHGGPGGFHNVVWDVVSSSKQQIEMTYLSVDGEEGFPGNLQVSLTYALNEVGELSVVYKASTDKKTVVNLTHHSFFNLAGEGSGSIEDHLLFIEADRFNPVDQNLIPSGILPVEGTPFDFRQSTAIGKRINESDQQLEHGGGYDHNFVLTRYKENDSRVRLIAEVKDPASGRTMKVFTNEPGIQFYSGNFLNGKDKGKSGKAYTFRSAFCLETQHFPDSPNQSDFPSTILSPGQTYNSACIYKFGAE